MADLNVRQNMRTYAPFFLLLIGLISGCATTDIHAPPFSAAMPTVARSYQMTFNDGAAEWIYCAAEYSPGTLMEKRPTVTIIVHREPTENLGDCVGCPEYAGMTDLFRKNLKAFHSEQKIYQDGGSRMIRRDVIQEGATYRIGVWIDEEKFRMHFGSSDEMVKQLWISVQNFTAGALTTSLIAKK